MFALAIVGWCASAVAPLQSAAQGVMATPARPELASSSSPGATADGGAAPSSAREKPSTAASDGGSNARSSLPADRDSPPASSDRREAAQLPTAREPSVSAVIRMAARAARSLDPDRLRELARRARLSGLAPELRFSVERGFDQDLTSSSSSASDTMRAAVGDELRFAATLTFDLDRLIFAPEEVRLLSVERWLASDRRKLVSEVVRLYFQRRRLLREQADARAPDDDLADSIREVEAVIDALTGGEFSAALAKARARD
jgi:hypothetical protein